MIIWAVINHEVCLSHFKTYFRKISGGCWCKEASPPEELGQWTLDQFIRGAISAGADPRQVITQMRL